MPLEFGEMTLYTVDDLAEMLSVSVTTVRSYIRSGVLKGRKMGRRWYVPDESVQQYFREMQAQGRVDMPRGTVAVNPAIPVHPEELELEEEEDEIYEEGDTKGMPSPSREEQQIAPPRKSAPPPAPAKQSTTRHVEQWSDDMRDLLLQAERLRREARRVEEKYANSENDPSSHSDSSEG